MSGEESKFNVSPGGMQSYTIDDDALIVEEPQNEIVGLDAQQCNRVGSRSLLLNPSEESNLGVSSGSMQGYNTDSDALIAQEPQNNMVMSGTRQKHEKSISRSTAQNNKSSKKLERHTMSLWLASAFAIASIFIWATTCTLSYKPVQFKTYFDTTGQISRDQFEQNDRWRRVSRIGLQALGTLSIPLTSAVCTKAVVAYFQRSSNNRQPTISMRQTLVLADKGWLDLNTWMNLFGPMAGRIYSPLLILSLLLCGLGKNMLPRSAGTMILTFLQAFSISILQGAFMLNKVHVSNI